MNPSDYLDPTDALPLIGGVTKESSTLVNIIPFKHGKTFPGLKQGDIVIVGFPENRNSNNTGASKSPDLIRSYLYRLASFPQKVRIIDAGNLKPTKSPSDSYSAIKDLIDYFLSHQAIVIILGGTQEISVAVYQAISLHRKNISVSFVDSHLDIGSNDGDFSATSYLQKFLDEPLLNLFNLSIVGYQGYLVDSKQIDSLIKMNHESLRLGYVRGNFREIEPTFRDSDFVSFDLNAVRYSDCPGNTSPSPNGLYAEEACQLSRFSGLSDKTCCFGIFELNSTGDPSGQSAHLSAQLVWHFIEACSQRKSEVPYNNIDFKKFIVNSSTPGIEMVFYKSLLSDNWWMEIPSSNVKLYPKGKIVVACSYNDYVMASKQELPERWIRIYNKVV
jgi:formiminoglutamase